MATFRYAVRRFKKSASSWLTDEDYPAVTALEAMAVELDKHVTSALANSFGQAYRALLARKPSGPPAVDPLTAALEEAEGDK